MPVELTWDGKYDADGRRKSPLKIALPFQTIETVNESVQERQRNMFAAAASAEFLFWSVINYFSSFAQVADKTERLDIFNTICTA